MNYYNEIKNKLIDIEILQAVPAKLTWSHHIELLSLENTNEINYYIEYSSDNRIYTRNYVIC